MTRRAVVLFNLGGPDSLQAVKPFLFNLFNDPAIITAPGPLRWLLARYISISRAPIARKIYQHLGGKSPLLELTMDQAAELEFKLSADGDTKVFIAMRYWHPFGFETVRHVKEFDADEIVLLPLYPQYSSTTSGSSLSDWRAVSAEIGLDKPTYAVNSYPTDPGLIAAQARLLKQTMAGKAVRVLFSAHGLPKKFIDQGDPYQAQIELTAAAIAAAAGLPPSAWSICYQSRVGRLEWIGPSIDTALEQAAEDKVGVVVLPIAFVSEHSETLVELDIEYREIAEKLGIDPYLRVPAVGTAEEFIDGLAKLAHKACQQKSDIGEKD